MFPASYSEFERARSFLPASYCGVALCMILCFGKVLGRSHVEGLVVATSYRYGRPGCLSGNSTLESFETF